ncbi:MAG: hypothetical protein L6R41_000382 [Letrouitia leprolyta]|nr:MAG: hypothetical protein L6R41_000382 [Letrouitia leprolyta]
MASEIHRSDFPGGPEPSELTSDVSSFRLVASAASEIYEFCGKGMLVPGWAQIGEHDGIVVALWGKDSAMDGKYPEVPEKAWLVDTS